VNTQSPSVSFLLGYSDKKLKIRGGSFFITRRIIKYTKKNIRSKKNRFIRDSPLVCFARSKGASKKFIAFIKQRTLFMGQLVIQSQPSVDDFDTFVFILN
jgi:hypothetical protein